MMVLATIAHSVGFDHMSGYGWSAMVVVVIGGLAVVGGALALAMSGRSALEAAHDRSLHVLRELYASGQIDDAEFRHRLDVLNS
jgi:uncharacterized membrane protein